MSDTSQAFYIVPAQLPVVKHVTSYIVPAQLQVVRHVTSYTVSAQLQVVRHVTDYFPTAKFAGNPQSHAKNYELCDPLRFLASFAVNFQFSHLHILSFPHYFFLKNSLIGTPLKL